MNPSKRVQNKTHIKRIKEILENKGAVALLGTSSASDLIEMLAEYTASQCRCEFMHAQMTEDFHGVPMPHCFVQPSP